MTAMDNKGGWIMGFGQGDVSKMLKAGSAPPARQLNSIQVEETIRMEGTIKWFNPSRGFGFMAPDVMPEARFQHDGSPDVLVHATVLREGGYETIFEGARLTCDVAAGPKGLQAVRALAIDYSTAVYPSWPLPKTQASVQPESDWTLATVKWHSRVRGFGFLTCGEGTPDIFVHTEIMRHCGFIELRQGQQLYVRYGRTKNGYMAATLKPVSSAQQPH